MAQSTIIVTDASFDEDVIKSEKPVLVDYWAEWCGPCRAFGPIFDKAAEENPDIVFGKCNTQKEEGLAAAMNITSIPTLMAFKQGILVLAQPGMLPAPVLKELIGKIRELDMDEVRLQIAEEKAKVPSA